VSVYVLPVSVIFTSCIRNARLTFLNCFAPYKALLYGVKVEEAVFLVNSTLPWKGSLREPLKKEAS